MTHRTPGGSDAHATGEESAGTGIDLDVLEPRLLQQARGTTRRRQQVVANGRRNAAMHAVDEGPSAGVGNRKYPSPASPARERTDDTCDCFGHMLTA